MKQEPGFHFDNQMIFDTLLINVPIKTYHIKKSILPKKIFKKNFDMNLEDFYHNAALAINGEKVVDIEQIKNTLKQIKEAVQSYSDKNNMNYDDLLSNYYFEFKK